VQRVAVGDELRRDVVLFTIHGTDEVDGAALLRMIVTGTDRSFDQDPLFAIRLLVDIALRAISPAINDPITAAQAIGGIHELLHTVVGRDLDIGRIRDGTGALRVVLKTPTWEDYLAIGVDELTPYVAKSPQARDRLVAMVDALLAEAPASRRPSLQDRRREVAALGDHSSATSAGSD
jgi:uncharacterized membrane protein